MQKDFDTWNSVKKNIDKHHKPPLFREREIWWCSIGINIGYEILGKGNNFTRPVLVIKKYSAFSFLGIPMTSQMRIFDARRLYRKLEKINENEFDHIKNKIIQTHFQTKSP